MKLSHIQVHRTAGRAAFTLVELLLSMVILSLILIVATSVMTQTQKTWLQSSARIEQFREARQAFELITQSLRQATLNTYMTYQYNTGDTPTVPEDKTQAPTRYVRHSELQFITGGASTLLGSASSAAIPAHGVFFQGTIGASQRDGYELLNRLLCGRGYFVMHGDDSAYRPTHVTKSRSRFRLMEYRPPAERNQVYSVTPGQWFKDAEEQIINASETESVSAFTRPVTENIIALVIAPRVPEAESKELGRAPDWIAPSYAYDSVQVASTSTNSPQGTQHLLPPMLQVTLVAVDEISARKLEEKYMNAPPPLLPPGAFSTASKYQQDLKALEDKLQEEKLDYRVFSSTITLRNSKWAMYGH